MESHRITAALALAAMGAASRSLSEQSMTLAEGLDRLKGDELRTATLDTPALRRSSANYDRLCRRAPSPGEMKPLSPACVARMETRSRWFAGETVPPADAARLQRAADKRLRKGQRAGGPL